MKTLLTTIVCALLVMPVAWAQDKPASLKDLAVNQMNEYAETLYNRHDYEGAKRVFGRVLQLDPTNAAALAHVGPVKPVKTKSETVPNCCALPKPVVIAKPADPNQDIKTQIADEDKAIQVLHDQIAQLQKSPEVFSHE